MNHVFWYHTEVSAQWIDYNGHMQDAFYGLVFSHAVDDLQDAGLRPEDFDTEGKGSAGESAEDRAAWANAMPSIAQEWAAVLDEAGEPGSEMLAAYLAKLEAAGYTGVRNWSE